MRLKSFLLAFAGVTLSHIASGADLLNASYDVSRELFDDINPAFIAQWKAKTGEEVRIRQSHGGSSKQARSVADGLPADIVTFNQVTDIELLEKRGLVATGWRQRLPHGASPYYSLPVLLVREGNPKRIRDWSDLVQPGIQVVFPNPKTSGNGRYTYLAAYAYALDRFKGDRTQATAFVGKLLANVPVFDTGGRGASTTFIERGIGDVLVTFESEITAIRKEYGKSKLEAVTPSLSLRADFPVAVVDKVVDKKRTRKAATAYLEFLFSPQGQDIIAKHYNRVDDPAVSHRYAQQFPSVKLVTVDQALGGWEAVSKEHFADGGILDRALLNAPAR
ncbi:sulfate transport system substrate-binding protein [Povalibacter uvarum]|uniref:Sulfate transport system substrate-binding protein n=1 Tax=Povalibacter uvarum TaxID=732238 RepID=A0A841HJG4_9GAMM|nr:sulfate ABC transporter substrate-binding protein [Povalibacter uvarum]MBB6092863.1 sulfate transport system substrate-binding protein [Povalibacter uvarum]